MIVRRDQPIVKKRDEPNFGAMETARYSDYGGLKQYGAYVQTLLPGARSSTRHWHEQEDEFLYVLEGQVTVVENDGVHTLSPGDAEPPRLPQRLLGLSQAGTADSHCC